MDMAAVFRHFMSLIPEPKNCCRKLWRKIWTGSTSKSLGSTTWPSQGVVEANPHVIYILSSSWISPSLSFILDPLQLWWWIWKIIHQNGFGTSFVPSGTCGRRVLQSNRKLFQDDDNDHSNDYKEDDNDQMIITLKHNKRLKKETLFMWIMKELLR